jgi:thioredoxin reductase
MTLHCDVVIVGAGPAGGRAALEAARHGLNTVIIDEQPKAGGQVWRAKAAAIRKAPRTIESEAGERFRKELAASTVVHHHSTRVWQIEHGDGWRLGLLTETGASVLSSRALIIAAGAQERILPVPGWTLPGVIGLAGATALFKSDLVLPGRRTIVAGCGPLLFFVASEILRLGGSVAAVVSLNSRADWLRALPGMATRPDLLGRGAQWLAKLTLAGVPILWRHAVASIEGSKGVQSAVAVPVDASWTPLQGGTSRNLVADSICIGHGLFPAIEASRLAGAEHAYDPLAGGWRPITDSNGATSVPMLWCCGDGAGILGVDAAVIGGALAGLAAAESLGAADTKACTDRRGTLARQHASAKRFGEAVASLTVLREGLLELITPETTVCRCESIYRREIEAEIDAGAASLNAIKSGTRSGMGPCGGRYCSETTAFLVARTTGCRREEIGLPTARPPLRPVPLDSLTQDFDYESLPIPGSAPL